MAKEDKDYNTILEENNRRLKSFGRSLTLNQKSLRSVNDSLIGNFNVVSKLTDVYKKAETLQLKAITLGTSYSKFVANNTKAINNSIVSNQKMTEALMTGFDQGLRNNTDELNSLISEMTFLGQDTKGMTSMLADMGGITGDNMEIQKNVVNTLKSTNKDYGVATDNLVRGLVSLQGTFEQFNIYGPEAVESLAELKIGLTGRTGGKESSKRQIDTILKLADAMKVQEQGMLGIGDWAKDVRDGTASAEQTQATVIRVMKEFKEQSQGNDLAAGTLREIYGAQTVDAVLALGATFQNSYELNAESRAAEDEIQKTLKSKQEQVDKFYDKFAPEMHQYITSIIPGIIVGRMIGGKMGPVTGRGKAFATESRKGFIGPQRKPSGMGGKMGMLGMGAMGGPWGLAIAGAIAFGPMIYDAVVGTSDKIEEQTKAMKDARSKNDAKQDQGLKMAANIARDASIGNWEPETQKEMLRHLSRIADSNARILASPRSKTSED